MNNQLIDSQKLDDFYEEILPSIRNFLKDCLLPSVTSPENRNQDFVYKFLGDLLQEKLEKTISEELALEKSITSDVLVGNNQNENLDNEIPLAFIEEIEGSSQKSIATEQEVTKKYVRKPRRNDDSDEFSQPGRMLKRSRTKTSKPVKKKQRLTKRWSVKAMLMKKRWSLKTMLN